MRIGTILGAVLAGSALAAAILSAVWTPYDITRLAIADKLLAPSGAHWFGTDRLGRDILSMAMLGTRTSLAVALVAAGIGMGLGVPLDLLAAAWRGRWPDDLVMRGNDLIFAVPSRVIAIGITAVREPSALNAIIGIFNIPVFARVARGALPIWTLDYIRAAQVADKGAVRVSAQHILPNIAGLLVMQGTIQFSLGILAEAGLSYVGLGVQPPTASWGRIC